MTAIRRRDWVYRLLASIVLSGALTFGLPGRVAAETFRVVNVPPGDELNVRVGPSVGFPVLGTLARDATGVESLGPCAGGWCPVRSGHVMGWASERFLEAESASSEPTDAPATATIGIVLPDGTLERSLPDGRRVRQLPNGNLQTVWPDGRVSVSTFVTAPGAGLPALPPEVSGWAGNVSEDLLTILENILTSEEMTAYLQTEAGKDLVQLLNWRLRSIRFLTTPAT